MAEFIFKARVTLGNVPVFITADSLAEAQKKAKAGDYDEYDSSSGDGIDVEIDVGSGKLNA